jgi:hypothetical protein
LKKKLTKRDTIKIWKEECDARGIEIIIASDVIDMAQKSVIPIAKFMLSAGGIDPDNTLNTRYVSFPGYIICPHRLGGKDHYERVAQLGVLDHELTHHDQMGDVEYWINDYLLNKANRAIYEGQAFGGDADIATYFGFPPLHPSAIFNKEFRKTYRVTVAQMAEGRKAYERQLRKLKRGRPSTKAAASIAKRLKSLGYERAK